MPYDEELANRIREALADEDAITEQRMFGGLAFMVGGHMAIAASGRGGVLLRCDPAQTDELVKRPHAERFEMRGRAMDGWLRIASEGVRTTSDLEHWVRHGAAYARSLPPKG